MRGKLRRVILDVACHLPFVESYCAAHAWHASLPAASALSTRRSFACSCADAYLHLSRASLGEGQLLPSLRHAKASLRAVPAPNPHGHALAARALLGIARQGVREKGRGGKRRKGHKLSDGDSWVGSTADAIDAAASHALSAAQSDLHAAEIASHWSLLAEARTMQERWSEALPAFEAASSLAPADADAIVNLGAALLRLKRPSEAARHFRRALAMAAGIKRAGRVHVDADARTAGKARRGLEMAEHALKTS